MLTGPRYPKVVRFVIRFFDKDWEELRCMGTLHCTPSMAMHFINMWTTYLEEGKSEHFWFSIDYSKLANISVEIEK